MDVETVTAAERRRILLITDRAPASDSGYGLRVANVVRGLAAAGELRVLLIDSSCDRAGLLTLGDGVTASTVRAMEMPGWRKLVEVLGGGIPTLRYGDDAAVREQIAASVGAIEWDLVWCSRVRAHVASRHLVAGPRVVDFDDLNDRLERTEISDRRLQHGALRTAPINALATLVARRWQRLQRRIAGEVRAVGVCSEVDTVAVGVPNAAVVPNGYPDPGPPAARDDDSSPIILFVGPLTYEPNRLAVEWFVRTVWPRMRAQCPHVTFEVVGARAPLPAAVATAPQVVLHGRVDDVAPYYAGATVAVAPLHSGGGTRVKVIEALARGVPLVSTSFACEGFGLTAGRELLVADDPAAFAAACLALVDDPAVRRRLAEAGRRRYTSNMTANHCADAVTALARRSMTTRRTAAEDGDERR